MLVVGTVACGPSTTGRSPIPASLAPDVVILLSAAQAVVGCPANVVEGMLGVDDSAGTAIVDAGARTPIRWPYGYSGRRTGSQVEILDEAGTVVGRTGILVRLTGGEAERGVWLACPGPVTPK